MHHQSFMPPFISCLIIKCMPRKENKYCRYRPLQRWFVCAVLLMCESGGARGGRSGVWYSQANSLHAAQEPNAMSLLPPDCTLPLSCRRPCRWSVGFFFIPLLFFPDIGHASLHLLPAKDQPLLHRWNPFLFLDLLFDLCDLDATR